MPDDLLAALEASRTDFVDALTTVDADLVTVPGVMEDWSVRDLVVHVAAWAEHAVSALDLAMAGRGAEFDYSTDQTDAMNERILAEGRTTSPAAALAREEAAFAAFRNRLAALDPALLSHRLGNGDTVEQVVRYDGPNHYAEHTAHLRAWFEADEDDEDEDG
ncbi:MAG: ClbS/DfsB family four-helix bundle protein [Chloroflexota bacterium]|nr:ClbS/DfsB family four-helix bundle protein [Chloroflexota bacterium]